MLKQMSFENFKKIAKFQLESTNVPVEFDWTLYLNISFIGTKTHVNAYIKEEGSLSIAYVTLTLETKTHSIVAIQGCDDILLDGNLPSEKHRQQEFLLNLCRSITDFYPASYKVKLRDL